MRLKFKNQLGLSLALLVCAFVSYCQEPVAERIPTGMQVTDQPDGSLTLVATVRASDNAIEKDLVVMKRSTCLEGARLLIASELKDRGLNANLLRRDGAEPLRGWEYCRVTATYFPKGIPVPKESTTKP